jgi:cell division protease FtsH
VIVPADPGPTQTGMLDRARDKLKLAGPLVILTTKETALPQVLARLPVLRLASLGHDEILFALRELQSATGVISTAAVRAALPSAAGLTAGLATLALDDLTLAFRARGPLRTAARLADLCAQQAAAGADGGANARSEASADTSTNAGPLLDDLPGLGTARTPLRQIVSDLRAYANGTLPWADVTSGLILAGPPGTGKTTLAAAIARSAGLPLIATTCSDWHLKGRFFEMLAAMRVGCGVPLSPRAGSAAVRSWPHRPGGGGCVNGRGHGSSSGRPCHSTGSGSRHDHRRPDRRRG